MFIFTVCGAGWVAGSGQFRSMYDRTIYYYFVRRTVDEHTISRTQSFSNDFHFTYEKYFRWHGNFFKIKCVILKYCKTFCLLFSFIYIMFTSRYLWLLCLTFYIVFKQISLRSKHEVYALLSLSYPYKLWHWNQLHNRKTYK